MTILEALGRLVAAPNAPEATHLAEAGVKVDPDDDLFRNLGASYRDLQGTTLRRAQDISVDLYRSNPLANRIVKIYTTYMAGNGFSISCDNPEVQLICDEFWEAERNQMPIKHRRFARDYMLYGEAPHPVATDDTGNTTIGYIDPRRIDHVEVNPLNTLLLERVVLTRGSGDEVKLEVVKRETDPFEDDAGLYAGDIFLWLHDRIGASTRGTPFLLPIIDWLDAYDQTLWELLERVKATRAFFWDVMVEGGKDEIAEAQKLWGTTAPRSGSVRFHTSAMEVSAAQPNIGAEEDVGAARYLLRHIAVGAGLQPHWLGDPEDANRSTAQEMDKPVVRSLEDIQGVWKANMEAVLRYVVDRKVAADMLPRIVEKHNEQGEPTGEFFPASELVEVNVPQLTDDQMEAAAASLVQLANAFVQLDMIDVTDRETLRKVIRHLLPALGIPADELPDPDEDDEGVQIDRQLEAIYARAAANGSLAELNDQL